MGIAEVGTLPDMPNIQNLLTIIGHCFGHQSGIDESSGRSSTIFLSGIAFRVYLLFAQTGVLPNIGNY